MNDETLHSWIDPEFEARIVSLILGEASDFEREEIERKIADSPEATLFYNRMESLHGLLKQVDGKAVAGSTDADQCKSAPDMDDDEWKLSKDRREELLATLGDIENSPSEAMPVLETKPKRKWTRQVIQIGGSIAASLAVLLLLGGMLNTLQFSQMPMAMKSDSNAFEFWFASDSSRVASPQVAYSDESLIRDSREKRVQDLAQAEGSIRESRLELGEAEFHSGFGIAHGGSTTAPEPSNRPISLAVTAPAKPEAAAASAAPSAQDSPEFTREFRGGARNLRGANYRDTNGNGTAEESASMDQLASGSGTRPDEGLQFSESPNISGRIAVVDGGVESVTGASRSEGKARVFAGGGTNGAGVESGSSGITYNFVQPQSNVTLGFPTLEKQTLYNGTQSESEIEDLAMLDSQSGGRGIQADDIADEKQWGSIPQQGIAGGGGGGTESSALVDDHTAVDAKSELSRLSESAPDPSGMSNGVDEFQRQKNESSPENSTTQFKTDLDMDGTVSVSSDPTPADPFAAPAEMPVGRTQPKSNQDLGRLANEERKLKRVQQAPNSPAPAGEPAMPKLIAPVSGSVSLSAGGVLQLSDGESIVEMEQMESLAKLSEESKPISQVELRESVSRENYDALGAEADSINGVLRSTTGIAAQEAANSTMTSALRSGSRAIDADAIEELIASPEPSAPGRSTANMEASKQKLGPEPKTEAPRRFFGLVPPNKNKEAGSNQALGLDESGAHRLSDVVEGNEELSSHLYSIRADTEQKTKKKSGTKSNSDPADKGLGRKAGQVSNIRIVAGKPIVFSGFVPFPEKEASEEPFSTFSLHVGESSFQLARAALSRNQWPERESIRVEEFVNALNYRDPIPTEQEKVAVALDQARHPFLQQRNLLRISLATAARGRQASVPLRLTLLLDNSGSMERPDRRETVLRAFSLLLEQMQEGDEVTLISFARQPRLLADRVKGSDAEKLIQQIAGLPSEGGTNIEAALDLAFQKAKEQQVTGAQNRIILLTDGAANLGDAEPGRLSAKIESFRDEGIAFDAAGIGAQGLNDEVLEALTRKGDGRYYLLDRVEDADDGFARQIAGSLRPAAGNVKVQVEFNPDRVGKYHLLGFQKHRLEKEDFRNDAVDAAELAAAEAGVALYLVEAKPEGKGDIGFVSVRFRNLATGEMVENRWPILYDPNTPSFEQASPAIRLAGTASFLGSRLKEDSLGQVVDMQTLSTVINELPSRWKRDEKTLQLQQMIQQTRSLASE